MKYSFLRFFWSYGYLYLFGDDVVVVGIEIFMRVKLIWFYVG